MPGPSFDDQVEYAWHRYTSSFVALLSAMKPNDVITLRQPAADDHANSYGRITFTLTRGLRLRATIQPDDLHTNPKLRDAQIAVLVDAGWRRLGSGALIAGATQLHADRLAALGCQAMRAVWHVVHPAFLARPRPAPHEIFDSPFLPPGDQEETVLVTTGEQLFQLLKSHASPEYYLRSRGPHSLSLPPIAGFDSYLQIGSTPIAPSLEFHARIAPLADPRALGNVIYHVGRDWPTIALYIEDARLHAVRVVDCAAFHPENVRCGIRDWRDFLTVGAPRIIDLLDGARTRPVDDEGDIPPLLQKIYDERITTPTADLEKYFDGDVDLILDYQARCKRQIIEWMERAADAVERRAKDDYTHLRDVSTSWSMTDFALNLALQSAVLRRRGQERARDYY